MRTPSTLLLVTVLATGPAAGSALAQAPPPPLPQTYSVTVTTPIGPGTTTKVARDGSKESVEQTVPPSANGPGMHIRLLYDFAARKLWTMNLDGGPCTVVTYTSPAVPSAFDPISGAEEMRAGLAQYKPAVLRSETVNGIATKVYEMPFPDIKGKLRMFLEEQRNFAVKQVYVWGDGKEQTVMEVSNVSFAKPPADLFVPPQNCQALAGETNAYGGHVETGTEVAQAGGNQNAAARNAERRTPERTPAASGSRTAATVRGKAASGSAQVTEVRAVGVQPAHYTGPAPAAYVFTFAVTATGPVEATWVLVSQADTAWESGKIVFDAAGTKNLKVPLKIGVGNGQHWEGSGYLQVTVGATNTISDTLKVSADCRAK
jgi:hypothetical protein